MIRHVADAPATTSTSRHRHEIVRDAIAKALRDLPESGGLRALAVDGLTCVVEWRPTSAGASAFQHVRLCLRRGHRRVEHTTTLADLTLLPRTCEHHLLAFDREPTDGGDAVSRLRARLAETASR